MSRVHVSFSQLPYFYYEKVTKHEVPEGAAPGVLIVQYPAGPLHFRAAINIFAPEFECNKVFLRLYTLEVITTATIKKALINKALIFLKWQIFLFFFGRRLFRFSGWFWGSFLILPFGFRLFRFFFLTYINGVVTSEIIR